MQWIPVTTLLSPRKTHRLNLTRIMYLFIAVGGLPPERSLLFVNVSAKALHQTLTEVLGECGSYLLRRLRR
jgi:hypothetical protein